MIPAHTRRKLILAYKAFYELAMKQQGGVMLSSDQVKAIGQAVLETIIDKAVAESKIDQDEEKEFREEFNHIIRQVFPNNLGSTTLLYRDNRFYLKD